MSLPEFNEMEFDKTSEVIVDSLVNQTQTDMRNFYRMATTYQLCVMASMMNCTVNTADRGDIPVNAYIINLATSGAGKGMSSNILEDKVVYKFRKEFVEGVYPTISNITLQKKAEERSLITGIPFEDEMVTLEKEFSEAGELPYDYDSGTAPAFKQIRHKCLVGGIGALNLVIDEVGSMLGDSTDLLNMYLQSYDVGKIKQKLIKNTKDAIRTKEIEGRVPCNMLLFGTQDRLLDGGATEVAFESMLGTGFARRCLFGFSSNSDKLKDMSPEEIYNKAVSGDNTNELELIAEQFGKLANTNNFNKVVRMEKEVNILLIEYRLDCEEKANNIPNNSYIHKAELMHRYFKVLKISGAYAFKDGSDVVTKEHLFSAIKLAEDSGRAFNKLMDSEKPHIKLAKYIADSKYPVNRADFTADLPSYTGTESHKRELISLAMAYGQSNNISITSIGEDGVTLYSGERLQETDLDRLIISFSDHITENYRNDEVPFNKLYKGLNTIGYNFVNHHLEDKKENEPEEEEYRDTFG